jgi:hypothetical protein
VSYSRTAAVTDNVLRGFQKMIRNTISDLKDHLKDHLNTLPEDLPSETRDFFQAADEINAERECPLQCLVVCNRVLEIVDKVQSKTIQDIFAAENTYQALVCTPEDYATAVQIYEEKLRKLKKIIKTNGDLTSAKQVVKELGGKQSIQQTIDVLTMRLVFIELDLGFSPSP